MAHTAHTTDEAMQERFDSPQELEVKLDKLAALVKASKHFVAFTGAGISTSAGIPDFRGPDGVWTLRAQGRSRTGPTTSTIKAFPTKTHMSLVELQRRGVLKHLISQNTDGLLRRSGFHPEALSELHGNSNMEECEQCQRRYFRDFSCRRLQMTSDHFTGRHCGVCGGRLLEWTIDFGQTLPEDQLEAAVQQSKLADLHLALGSSLTVSPACDMPRTTGKKRGGKLVIVNLQKTPLDDLATIRIYAKTDAVMEGLMRRLEIPIPEWRLHRRVIVSVRHTEKGSNVVVQGVDVVQALPATLFTKVEVIDRHHSNASRVATTEPLTVAFAHRRPQAVDLQLHFQGHYNEPPVVLPGDMSVEGDVIHALTFNPFDGTWQVGEARPCALELLNSVLLKKREEMGVHRRPLAVQVICDSRFGSWPTASYVNIEGKPVGVVIGGKSHTVSLIDLSTGAVVAPTNLDPEIGCVGKPRWGHTASVYDNKVVLIGGWDSSCQYGDVIVYDPIASAATVLQTSGDSLAPRSCHAAAVVEEQKTVYVFGGALCRNGPYHYYDDLLSLDLCTGTWRSMPRNRGEAWPSARSQHSLTSVNGRLVLVGGCDATRTYDDIWTFDLANKRWTLVCEHSAPESGIPALNNIPQTDFRVHALRHTATLIGPRLLLWGKWGMSMLNLDSCTWTKLAVPPKCVANAVCSDGRNLWSFGGIDPDSQEPLPVLCLSS